jgi:ribosomal protein L24
MEAINILKLLKQDIVNYFNSKAKGQQGLGFLQTFTEYSHLLDETHKQTLVELKAEVTSLRKHKLDRQLETQRSKLADTKKIDAFGDRIASERERTRAEIGTEHLDNTRGALKKLDTPGHEKIASFNKATRTRVVKMIDALIAHLRASRKRLTEMEIKAAEDFAIFQNSTEKENEYLEEKIAELTKEILELTNQINISKVQLVKRKKLRDQAKARLELLRKMCREKKAYFAKETARRRLENTYIDQATKIFETKLMHLSARVRARASGGVKVGEMQQRVVASEKGVTAGAARRIKERENVVF